MGWVASLVFRLALVYIPATSVVALLGNPFPLGLAIAVFVLSAVAKEN